jgi:hypothetical protein
VKTSPDLSLSSLEELVTQFIKEGGNMTFVPELAVFSLATLGITIESAMRASSYAILKEMQCH